MTASSTASQFPPDYLIDFDDRPSSVAFKEMCSLVCRWLADHEFHSTLQVFRDEINTQGKEHHAVRKAARGIAKGLEEGNWEAAHASCKKIDGIVADAAAIQLMLAKQQFLELVDEGDGQRAFSFFIRRIKPFEDSMSRTIFQQLAYLLTCRSVADAAALYPELRGWNAATSRSSLLSWISRKLHDSSFQSYTVEHKVEYCFATSLERVLRQALSFQYLLAVKPELLSGFDRCAKVSSVLMPLEHQLPPLHKRLVLNLSVSAKTCQPYLHVPAVAVGTVSGDVLWCRLQEGSAVKEVIVSHTGRVWDSHGTRTLLATCGGQTICIFSVESMSKRHEVPVHSEPFAVAISQDEAMVAAGLSNGDVVMMTLADGSCEKRCHRIGTSTCTSVTLNITGSTLYAGFRDGAVVVLDTATAVVTRTLNPPVRADVTSVALSPTSTFLLVAYKSNCLRVWNAVTGALESRRFGGLINQTKSFVRATFGVSDAHVFSGSEDGKLCFWQRDDAAANAESDSTTTRSVSCLPSTKVSLYDVMVVDVKFSQRFVVACSATGCVTICGTTATDDDATRQL